MLKKLIERFMISRVSEPEPEKMNPSEIFNVFTYSLDNDLTIGLYPAKLKGQINLLHRSNLKLENFKADLVKDGTNPLADQYGKDAEATYILFPLICLMAYLEDDQYHVIFEDTAQKTSRVEVIIESNQIRSRDLAFGAGLITVGEMRTLRVRCDNVTPTEDRKES